TLTIKDAGVADDRPWLDRAVAEIETRLFDVLDGPPARPGCIPATTTERATPALLPVDEQKSVPTPEQINPGLAPGMSASPRNRTGLCRTIFGSRPPLRLQPGRKAGRSGKVVMFLAPKRSQRRCVEATGVSRMQRSNPDGDTG